MAKVAVNRIVSARPYCFRNGPVVLATEWQIPSATNRRKVQLSGNQFSENWLPIGEGEGIGSENSACDRRLGGTAVAIEFAVIFYNCHREHGRFAGRGFTLVEAVCAIALIGVGVASVMGALTKFNSIAATSRNATGAAAVVMNQIDLFQSMGPFNPQRNHSTADCDNVIHKEIPKDYAAICAGNLPTYDMTAGAPGTPVTHTIAYKDPTTGVISTQPDPWPVYREPAQWTYANAAARTGASGFIATDVGRLAYQTDTQEYYRLQTTAPTWALDNTSGIIVKGTMTSTVTDISTASAPNTYRAVFTIGYQFLGRGPIFNATSNRWEYQLSMSVIRTSDI